MYRTVFWTLWERVRVGRFGRMALKHVYYHMWNESPVQVWCMIQDARGWCTGMTKRNGMGREVGGRFRMGNTCTPVVDSCWCMAKPIQYCKVKKKKDKNLKKKKLIETAIETGDQKGELSHLWRQMSPTRKNTCLFWQGLSQWEAMNPFYHSSSTSCFPL